MHKRECKRREGQVRRVIASFFIKLNWVGVRPAALYPYRSTCISVGSASGADVCVQETARLGKIW